MRPSARLLETAKGFSYSQLTVSVEDLVAGDQVGEVLKDCYQSTIPTPLGVGMVVIPLPLLCLYFFAHL